MRSPAEFFLSGRATGNEPKGRNKQGPTTARVRATCSGASGPRPRPPAAAPQRLCRVCPSTTWEEFTSGSHARARAPMQLLCTADSETSVNCPSYASRRPCPSRLYRSSNAFTVDSYWRVGGGASVSFLHPPCFHGRDPWYRRGGVFSRDFGSTGGGGGGSSFGMSNLARKRSSR